MQVNRKPEYSHRGDGEYKDPHLHLRRALAIALWPCHPSAASLISAIRRSRGADPTSENFYLGADDGLSFSPPSYSFLGLSRSVILIMRGTPP